VGKLAGNDLVPAYELALSGLVSDNIPVISLKKEQALQYLRKEEVTVGSAYKGWGLVQYEGHALGWVKLLTNRINNYYPKEWRILKSESN
jgi:NOL1/NOP2/fmu family ribosome biogenesis protein